MGELTDRSRAASAATSESPCTVRSSNDVSHERLISAPATVECAIALDWESPDVVTRVSCNGFAAASTAHAGWRRHASRLWGRQREQPYLGDQTLLQSLYAGQSACEKRGRARGAKGWTQERCCDRTWTSWNQTYVLVGFNAIPQSSLRGASTESGCGIQGFKGSEGP